MSTKIRSGAEIQQALREFADRWRGYRGTERSEVQTFLNELFACYGSDRRQVGAQFEDNTHSAAGIMDLRWRDLLIVEMKAPSEADRLDRHREQALKYWFFSSDAEAGRPAPRYVVLCAFHRFEVWEPGRFPDGPRATFTLDELPDRYETLLFLTDAGDEALFEGGDKDLTTDAATAMAALYRGLLAREATPAPVVRNFVLQTVWLFFAEDYGMIEGRPTERLIRALIRYPQWTSYMAFGGLFLALNDSGDHGRHGLLEGTRYVNGELFAEPGLVHLHEDELDLLARAARYDWREVNPTIFGSLMEGFLGEEREVVGAHYTHESDIMKIVRPTIVRPWRERIAATTTPQEARDLLDELCRFRVLDPACGCGNFLYVAYRELRSLEHELKQRITDLARRSGLPEPPKPWPYYPLCNLHGIDIVPAAAQIARVTLWMGHRQMIDRYGPAEPPPPLVSLSTIQTGDALALDWPEVDCIVGNPPFLGSQHLRAAHGDAYLKWLDTTFKVGIKDYCVYWFRKAHDHLKPGQRAGLVGTNSISQNRARSASLEYITANGGVITEAVSTQKWPGDAKVHVSLVNWVKRPATPPTACLLDGEVVGGITAELRPADRSTAAARPLPANKRRCFQGPIPVGEGFVISADEAHALLACTDADYRQVVRPYLTGDDIADDPGQRPRRWIIDFAQMPLEEAMRYPAALAIVRERVKPVREMNSDKAFRRLWWRFGRPRGEMRRAIAGLPRYIAVVAQGKRALFAWCEPWTCPSNLTYVFAFDDDFAMGVLSSSVHGAWAWSRGSTLKGDLRYTPTTVFEAFPWPYPVSDEQRERVAEASRRVIARRREICAMEGFGLTRLYNLVDDGAYADLTKLHRELDEAVAAAYGWAATVAQDDEEIVRRLLRLNQGIASGERPYDPFGREGDATGTLDFAGLE